MYRRTRGGTLVGYAQAQKNSDQNKNEMQERKKS